MTPVVSGWTVSSGSLSILDRYSAYGVFEPNVLIANFTSTEGDWVWDFVTIAVRPTGYIFEASGTYSLPNQAYGSNDGETWEEIELITGTFDSGAGGISRFAVTQNTTKFYRYLKVTFAGTSSGTGLRFHAFQWSYDASRPWSEDGQGGVGPGGDGGGANDPGGENDPSTHEGFEMSDLSVYAGDLVLGWIKGSDMPTAPTEIWVALYDGDPDDPDTPGSELTGTGGLSRKEVTFGSIVARYMLNTNKVEFGIPDSEVTVACFCLYDAETDGNRITKKMLDTPATFDDATMILFQPGKLPVYY